MTEGFDVFVQLVIAAITTDAVASSSAPPSSFSAPSRNGSVARR